MSGRPCRGSGPYVGRCRVIRSAPLLTVALLSFRRNRTEFVTPRERNSVYCELHLHPRRPGITLAKQEDVQQESKVTAARSRRWTASEVQQLHALVGTVPAEDIAQTLGRSLVAIRIKAAHERLPLLLKRGPRGRSRQPFPWEHRDPGP